MQSQTHMPTTVYVIDTCCKLSNAGALQGLPKTTDPNLSAAVFLQEETQNCVTMQTHFWFSNKHLQNWLELQSHPWFSTKHFKTGLTSIWELHFNKHFKTGLSPTFVFSTNFSKLLWNAIPPLFFQSTFENCFEMQSQPSFFNESSKNWLQHACPLCFPRTCNTFV